MHGGPPCKAFSCARTSDRHGTARQLRSERFPQGLPGLTDPRIVEGNELAKRYAKLATYVHRAGGWWSLENLETSYMWEYLPVKALANLPGARFYKGHQCWFGGLYPKPTCWLTNAAFLEILVQKCPGFPAHPRHPSLQGRVKGPDGKDCWLTSLAAEYPQGLCEELAKESAKVVAEPIVRESLISLWAAGTKDPCKTIKKDQRQAENDTYIGGLRDPASSVARISGWGPVGSRVAAALSGVIRKCEAEFVDIFEVIGTEHAHGPASKYSVQPVVL